MNCSFVTTMIEGSFCFDLSTLSNCPKFDSNKNGSCKSLVVFKRCFGVYWPPSFIRRFLQTSPCSKAWPSSLSKFSKGAKKKRSSPFSFYVTLVEWTSKHRCNYALVSTMPPTLSYLLKHSHPLWRWCPWLHLSMVGITWRRIDSWCCPLFFLQPFFLFSLNLILEFFLQLQYTHMNSFLSSWLIWWHSSTKCNHSSWIYFSTKIVLSIFTFSMIMLGSPLTSSKDAMILISTILASNN